MFISQLQISNYKAFNTIGNTADFKVPDNEMHGSGLNIFVGENGTGKTSILESINLLTQSKFSTLNKLSIFDFNDDTKPIEITARTDQPFRYEMPETYRGSCFECNGFHFLAETRKDKERGKLLSDPIRVAVDVTKRVTVLGDQAQRQRKCSNPAIGSYDRVTFRKVHNQRAPHPAGWSVTVKKNYRITFFQRLDSQALVDRESQNDFGLQIAVGDEQLWM